MPTKNKLLVVLGLFATSAALAQQAAPPPPPAGAPPAPGAASPSSSSSSSSSSPGSFGTEETTPFVFGIRQGFTAEDNLFHAPDGQRESDRISSTGLTLGIDKPIGRQRFSADVRANVNRYRDNKQLNNTDYRAAARLDWETVERVSGEISAEQRQSLYRDRVAGVISTDRNQVRSSSLAFQARVGLVTRWSLEGGVAASEDNYTGTTVDNRDVRQRSANAGLRWRPSDALSAHIGARHTQGSYPRFGAEPDDFRRNDIDLITNLAPSGASRLNARLSATRESHSQQSQRDTDGWTGALGWDWRPTGKLSLSVDLLRDSSVGRSGFESSLIGAESSDASEMQSASLAITWEATAKVQVTPRFSYVRRKLDNAFGGGGGVVESRDNTTSAGISVSYQPIRALDLGCGIAREQRRTDSAATLTAPYTATVATCSAEFALR